MNRPYGVCSPFSNPTWKPIQILTNLVEKSILLALLALGAWSFALPFRSAPPLETGPLPSQSSEPSQNAHISSQETSGKGTTTSEGSNKTRVFPPPDDGGRILEVTLHYCRENEEDMELFYQDFFEKFSTSARILLVCSTQECETFFEEKYGTLARKDGRQIIPIVVNRPLSIWARDRRVARQTEKGEPQRSFIPPPQELYTEDKISELTLAETLWARGVAPRALTDSFILEGGNLVSNAQHIFVGKNVVSENAARFEDEAEAAQTLERIFGKPVVLLEDEFGVPPWFHADMYLTVLDGNTLGLADLTLGLRLLAGKKSEKLSWKRTSGWRTRLPSGLTVDFTAPESPIVVGLEAVRRQLESLGYQVIRFPALVNAGEEWMVSYTNVLMEKNGSEKLVYLPRYAIPALDKAARELWVAQGFKVKDVNVSKVFDLGGAIRCIANVTLREPVLPLSLDVIHSQRVEPSLTEINTESNSGASLVKTP